MRPHILPVLTLTSALAFPTGAAAQGAPESPTVTVAAHGVVEIEPTHAEIVFGARVEGETPQEAAAGMDRRLTAVADTLRALGFPADRLPNAGFSVNPVRAYRDNPNVDRFEAAASFRLRVDDMGRLPELIGAVLTAGANTVRNLQFDSDARAEARDRALERAVREARRDAERLADAAGARLGGLVEIRSGAVPRGIAAAGGSALQLQAVTVRQPITPRTIVVTAAATVTWRLEPSP